MAKRGRPSKYSDKLADEILQRLAGGESLRSICRDGHMPAASTVSEWYTGNKDNFSERYARARRQCAYSRLDRAHDELADGGSMRYLDADGNERIDSGAVQRARAYADYVRWEASKLIPEMADKMDYNHNVNLVSVFAQALEKRKAHGSGQ